MPPPPGAQSVLPGRGPFLKVAATYSACSSWCGASCSPGPCREHMDGWRRSEVAALLRRQVRLVEGLARVGGVQRASTLWPEGPTSRTAEGTESQFGRRGRSVTNAGSLSDTQTSLAADACAQSPAMDSLRALPRGARRRARRHRDGTGGGKTQA